MSKSEPKRENLGRDNSTRMIASLNFVMNIKEPASEVVGEINLEDYLWEHKTQWGEELADRINKELSLRYGNRVYARIASINKGSLILDVLIYLTVGAVAAKTILSTIKEFYDLISKYKDFLESRALLQEHIKLAIVQTTQKFLSAQKGVTEFLAEIQIIPKASFPISFRLAQLWASVKTKFANIQKTRVTRYLVAINLLLTIVVLFLLCNMTYAINSKLSTSINITQVVSTYVVIAPTALPSFTPLPSETNSPVPQPSPTPTLSPTSTASAIPTKPPPSLTPAPLETTILQTPTTVTTTSGVQITLPNDTVVFVISRRGCEVRIYWRETNNQSRVEVDSWIDRSFIGESCP